MSEETPKEESPNEAGPDEQGQSPETATPEAAQTEAAQSATPQAATAQPAAAPPAAKPDANKQGAERRASVRKIMRAPVMVTFQGHPPFKTYSLDVSMSGIGTVATVNFPVNATCSVSFNVMIKGVGNKQLQAMATVMYSIFSNQHDGFKVGLQFKTLSPEVGTLLLKYINS